MTMLDRMRRHRNWLKYSLGLVVLTFIVFYIPDFLNLRGRNIGTVPSNQTVANVNGHAVSVAEFRRVYNAQLQAYRGAYGGQLNEQLLKQLGIDRQILQQLIDEQAALSEADRLGLSASDTEVRERILRIPAFQENGAFVGESRYRQVLRMQNPPISTTEFEESVRRSIVLEKLRGAVTDWISVTDGEVDQEYRRRSEQVKAAVLSLPADKFRESLSATDTEIASYFDTHKEEFRLGEKRKIRFLSIDAQALRNRVAVSPQDVERFYNTNIEQYSTPEQVRASHILFKTEGKDDAAVKKQAEDVLAQVKKGGDFAALAAKYPDDDASKTRGGDLDFFSKGRMVAEFEQAAFSMEPGTISDLVKTQFGYHIIKVVEKRAASIRSLDEVRPAITEQLKTERAQQQASELATKLESAVKGPADLDKVAKANGLAVQESGLFERGEPIMGLGPSPEAAAEAFTLKDGEVSAPVRTAQGYAILTLTGRQDPRVPKVDEVKDKVREAVVRKKAVDASRQKAAELLPGLRAAADFPAAAKTAGFEAQTTELVARGSAWPGVGTSAAVDAAAFALDAGAVSEPIVTDNATVIVKVTERKTLTPDEIAAGRSGLRQQMLSERRGRFFSSYMTKAKEKMKIRIDRDVLSKTVA